ncbi:MAG: hypothetical protein ACE5HE_10890 [Phycisphaerae bacterium]
MPSNAPITFSLANFPGGYCADDAQTFANDLVARLSGTLPGEYSTFVIGSSTPAAGDRDKLWIKTEVGTGLLTTPWAFFRYYNGQWLGTHPIPVTDTRIQIFKGALADIDDLDGGNSNAVSDTDGPFWQRDTDLDARFPVGVGTFPNEGAIGEEANGGVDQVTLTNANLGTHYHGTGNFLALNDDLCGLKRSWSKQGSDPAMPEYWTIGGYSTGSGEYPAALADPAAGGLGTTNNIGDSTNEATAHSNVPPWFGVYFIKRTARIYYVG